MVIGSVSSVASVGGSRTYGGGVLFMSADTLPRRLDVRLNQGQYFRSIFMYFEMNDRTVKMRRKKNEKRNVKRFAKFAALFFIAVQTQRFPSS